MLTLAIPRYREDIENYQDIAEEVIREYGYDKVVPTFLNEALVTNGGLSAAQNKELDVKKFLCTQGYFEIQTIAMTAKNEFDQFMIPADAMERQVVEILNPITENLSIMRTMVAPAMVRAIENNIKNGNDEVRFFELANVYVPKSLPLTEQPYEIKTLCIGSCGKEENFFTMKETLENLAANNDISFTYKRADVPYLHPGRSAEIYCDGQLVGTFGQLRYEVVDTLTIVKDKKNDVNIFLAEINYDVLKTKFKEAIKYVAPSTFATVNRDLSVVVKKEVSCGELMDAITSADALVKKVDLFDIFESEKLGLDKKSMAFSIKLASTEADVTDAMADGAIEKVLAKLAECFDAQMRS